MARKYTRIKELEKPIKEMQEAGKSRRDIGKSLGLTIKQIENHITRRNHRKAKKTERFQGVADQEKSR